MNTRHLSFWLIVCVGLFVAFAHSMGNEFFLYWKWWWFDVLMHFLGGVFVAALFIWAYTFFLKNNPKPVFSLLAVFVVGVTWEIFELTTGLMDPSLEGYTFDTITDIVLDMLGSGLVAYLLLVRPSQTKNPRIAGS